MRVNPETLTFVIAVSSVIMVIESVAILILIGVMIKKVSRASRVPLLMTGVVAILVGIFAVATGIGIMPISLAPISVSIVRSLMMLLLSLPIWIILAMYDAPPIDSKVERSPPG